jgi:hypothetical protein
MAARRSRSCIKVPSSSTRRPSTRPEEIADPKRALVNIARASSSRQIRDDLVPRQGSGRAVGPAYTSRLIEFINAPDGWRPEVAATECSSLAKARRALAALHDGLTRERFP